MTIWIIFANNLYKNYKKILKKINKIYINSISYRIIKPKN